MEEGRAKLTRTIADIKTVLDNFSYNSLNRLEVAIEYADTDGYENVEEKISELKHALEVVL